MGIENTSPLRLTALLNKFSFEVPLWVTSEATESRATLLDYLSQNSDLQKEIRGRRVAVQIEQPLALLRALFLCDGVAKSLILIPASGPSEMADALARHTQAEIYLRASSHDSVYLDTVVPSGLPTESPSKLSLQDTLWLIPTSGTTGFPKVVVHTVSTLCEGLSLRKDSHIWATLFHLWRFAGLQVLFKALVDGVPMVVFSHDESMDAQMQICLRAGVTAFSATPTSWRKLMMLKELPPFQQITLGGEIADRAILNALRQRFQCARITHIYASTEVGVGFSVNDGLEGFPKSRLYCQSQIQSERGACELKVDGDGMLLLKKRSKGSRYWEKEFEQDQDGFFSTGDLVKLEGERYIFLGRADGVINVAGRKVFASEVEAVLLSFPGVVFARVQAKKSAFCGSLVQAQIVMTDAHAVTQTLERALTKHCRDHLESFQVPVLFQFCAKIEGNK